ncbi:MAG: chemotaxis protein CheW [Spirochaetia bacterium]|nr:chemotaxis protein CheW [Spirochaetia bacterium]
MEKKVVGFRLKEDEYAFDIMKVIEIIRLKDITEVPTAPDFIEGVINLRGKIIPIIDLRRRFKLGDMDRTKLFRIIIVEFRKNQLVGVVVDEVSKVMNVKQEDILPAPPTVTGTGGRYIESIIKSGERIIVLLDIAKIFSEQEQDEMIGISEPSGGKVEESPNS